LFFKQVFLKFPTDSLATQTETQEFFVVDMSGYELESFIAQFLLCLDLKKFLKSLLNINLPGIHATMNLTTPDGRPFEFFSRSYDIQSRANIKKNKDHWLVKKLNK
jgi:hypothetical protein